MERTPACDRADLIGRPVARMTVCYRTPGSLPQSFPHSSTSEPSSLRLGPIVGRSCASSRARGRASWTGTLSPVLQALRAGSDADVPDFRPEYSVSVSCPFYPGPAELTGRQVTGGPLSHETGPGSRAREDREDARAASVRVVLAVASVPPGGGGAPDRRSWPCRLSSECGRGRARGVSPFSADP